MSGAHNNKPTKGLIQGRVEQFERMSKQLSENPNSEKSFVKSEIAKIEDKLKTPAENQEGGKSR